LISSSIHFLVIQYIALSESFNFGGNMRTYERWHIFYGLGKATTPVCICREH